MPNPTILQETSLKSLLSQTARQQSLLNGLHPTARAAPLLAFAVAGLVKQRTGVDVLDGLLGGGDGRIKLEAPAGVSVDGPGNGGRIWESCGNCWSGQARLVKGRNANMNMLKWMLDESTV